MAKNLGINSKTASKIADRIAKDMIAKPRPNTVFEGLFFDVKDKIKELKGKWFVEAGKRAEARLRTEMKNNNIYIVEFKLSLGAFRGARFVTSAKLLVKMMDEINAKKFESFLQTKFSPKYRLKSFKNNVATYNIR